MSISQEQGYGFVANSSSNMFFASSGMRAEGPFLFAEAGFRVTVAVRCNRTNLSGCCFSIITSPSCGYCCWEYEGALPSCGFILVDGENVEDGEDGRSGANADRGSKRSICNMSGSVMLCGNWDGRSSGVMGPGTVGCQSILLSGPRSDMECGGGPWCIEASQTLLSLSSCAKSKNSSRLSSGSSAMAGRYKGSGSGAGVEREWLDHDGVFTI